jgi:hypothetical protein
MKQALFHGAIVEDLVADPLAPPHPELTKYLEPPKKVLKRANEAVDQCKTAFAITKGLIWINSGKKYFSLCLQSLRESHGHAKKITRTLKMTTMRSFFLIVWRRQPTPNRKHPTLDHNLKPLLLLPSARFPLREAMIAKLNLSLMMTFGSHPARRAQSCPPLPRSPI